MQSSIHTLSCGTILHGHSYNYQIKGVLGHGAFGITYLASICLKGELGILNSNVSVAIKEFFLQDVSARSSSGDIYEPSPNSIAYKYGKKFKKEALNLARLNHQNIVKVLESFEENNTYYYVMEYIEGSSLDAYILEKGGLPEKEALQYVEEIGKALQYMHSQKMLHLDLKPKNIMRRTDNTLFLIDFGLSKQIDKNGEPESSTTIGLGTPGYAPLEQGSQEYGKILAPTLDIYALGATLFKMLTGKTPPKASEILNEGFAEEELRQKHISAQTISAIKKAMAPMRIKRPQTVNEFVALTHSTTNSHTDESAKHTSYNKQHATYQGIAFYYVQDDKLVYFLNDNIYELPLEGKTQVEEIIEKPINPVIVHFNTSLDAFIKKNRQSIQDSRFKVITYRKNLCHYFDVLRFINKYFDNDKTSKIRVTEEIHIASAIPCIIHSNDMPICICSKEEYCIAEYGEGLYEAEYSGVGTTEEHILQEYDVTSPAIPMTDLELYWEFLPKALSIWYSSVIGQISSFAFLDCLPFKVLAGYTLENHVRECSFLCNFYSFPLKRSVTFPGDGDSYFMEIDSRRFIIPLKDYLGYSPETIEITIDISYFLCDIIIEDVKYKKRVKIPLIGLISNSYTEEDTLKTNNK